MAIIKKKNAKKGKSYIDLIGPDGNVFYLMAMVNTLGKKTGLTKTDIEGIRKRMMSSDYENAILVFDEEFGDLVDLYR